MLSYRFVALGGASRFERIYAILATLHLDLLIILAGGFTFNWLLRLTSAGIDPNVSAIIMVIAMCSINIILIRDINKRSTILCVTKTTYKQWYQCLIKAGYKENRKAANHLLDTMLIECMNKYVVPKRAGFSRMTIGDDQLDKWAAELLGQQRI